MAAKKTKKDEKQMTMCGCRLKLRSKSAQPEVWVMDCNALVGEVDENFSKASCFDLAKCGFVDLLQSERKELHFEVGTDFNQMFGERVGNRSQQIASLLVNILHFFLHQILQSWF